MKTFVGNLFAASALTAFIATSVPAVSALALSSPHHPARHLEVAHAVKRNSKKKRCINRQTPASDTPSGGSTNNGGTTTNNGGTTTNNGGSSGGSSGDSSSGGSSGGSSSGGSSSGGSSSGGSSSGGSSSGGSSSGGSSSGGSSSGGSSGGGYYGAGSGLTGGKKGLAFPMGCSDIMSWHPNTDIHWMYNWRGTPYGDCPSGAPPFIPMLWGWDYLQSFIDATSNGKTPPIILFLNEPDLSSYLSSGVDPNTACSMWRQYIQPVRDRGARVGSAAVTSNPASIQWEKDFESICGVQPDFDTIHFYGTSVQDFKNYATNWYNTFKRPIWVTEVACQDFNGGPQCTMDQIYAFVGEIAHWCETTSFIEAYTFFGAMSDVQNVNYLDKMMNDYNNEPNALGLFMLQAY